MNSCMEFIFDNCEWLFSGLAITIVVALSNGMRALYCKLTQEVDYIKVITGKNNYVNQELFFSIPKILYISAALYVAVAFCVMIMANSIKICSLQTERIITGIIVLICQIFWVRIKRKKYDGINKKGTSKNYAVHIFVFLLYYDFLFMFVRMVSPIMLNIVVLIIESGMGVIILFKTVVHKEYMYTRILIFTTSSAVPIEVSVENIKVTSKDLWITYKEQNYIEVLNRQHIRSLKAFK